MNHIQHSHIYVYELRERERERDGGWWLQCRLTISFFTGRIRAKLIVQHLSCSEIVKEKNLLGA